MTSMSWVAAKHTDSECFGDKLCDGHQVRNRTKGLAEIVLIEPRDDDTDTTERQLFTEWYEAGIEELGFINPDNFNVVMNRSPQGVEIWHRQCVESAARVAGNFGTRIPVVDCGLEGLYILLGDQCSFESADEFLGLTREHGTTDDLDPAAVIRLQLHGYLCGSVTSQGHGHVKKSVEKTG